MAGNYQYAQYQQQQPQYPQHQQHPQAPNNYAASNQPYGTYSHQPQQYQNSQQPYQQYPQHQYQQQAQPYYPAQGYQTSQYPQQQYQASPPQHAYQTPQPIQHQAPQQPQQPQQPPPQACFNCGNQGHWAQNCPEPKREVPAGALNPEQHRRHGIAPHKRNSQIITKFTPQSAPVHGSPHGYGQPRSAGGYTQYPTPYTPSPHSAASAPPQWPQYGQQHSTQYPHAYYSAPQTPQQSFPTPATPGSAQAYGPPQVSQVSQASPQSAHLPYDPHAPFTQQQPPPNWQQPPTPSQPQNFQIGTAMSPSNASQTVKSIDQPSIPTIPPSASSKADLEEGEDPEEEIGEEDDLNALDLPDLPKSTELYGDAVVPAVAIPLPSNSVVADALAPFERASAEDGHRCHSKYWREDDDESLTQNVTDLPLWKELKEDVMFQQVPSVNEVVSIEDCRSSIKERQRPQEEVQRESRSVSRSNTFQKKEMAECTESLQALERALAEAKAKQAELISKKQAEMERKRKLKSSQSPGQEPKRIKEEDTVIKSEQMSPKDAAVASSSTYQYGMDGVRSSTSPTDSAKRTASQSRPETQGSPTNVETPSHAYNHFGERINGNAHYYSHNNEPPPPPPADAHSPIIEAGSPLSGSVNPFGNGTNQVDDGYFQYRSEYSNSSARLRSELSGSRKRDYESSSEDSDAPARRQEDDVTPKLKRRQPKVAEAYSRRW